jgi:predicted amidohydrolase
MKMASMTLNNFFALAILLMTSVSISLQAQAGAPSCEQMFKTKPVRKVSMEILKVAAVQFPLGEKANADQFIAKVGKYIDEAQKNGAQLVVFPELITTELVDWDHAAGDQAQLKTIAAEFTPRYTEWLKAQAQARGISILGGTTPRVVGNEIVNTAILALPDGEVILQDKIFLTPDEKDWQWTPGRALKVFTAPWGKTVIATCFDCEFPQVSNLIANLAPEVILVPSWTSTQNGLNRVDWTAKARAIEHHAYVVKTGTVPSTDSTQPHFGKASIVTPQEPGYPLEPVEGKLNEPSIVYGTLDLKLLRERKANSGYYPGKEQKQRIEPIIVESDDTTRGQ